LLIRIRIQPNTINVKQVKVTNKISHLHKDDSSFNFCVKVGLLQLEHRAGFHFLCLDINKNIAENPPRVDFDFLINVLNINTNVVVVGHVKITKLEKHEKWALTESAKHRWNYSQSAYSK
jgi:hypothetical protein